MIKATELRQKSTQELNELLGSQRREQFKLRLYKSGGEMTKTDQFKTIRRNIARILSILTEKDGKEGKA